MTRKAKILLIDDHRTVLRLLDAILKLRGYDLLYAETGQQGMALARQEQPDLILLDVRSPAEVEAAPFRDARVLNIPLGQLGVRLSELPKDKEIVTFCKISVRGYEAQRILNGEGFDNVSFLDGGIMAWPYPM